MLWQHQCVKAGLQICKFKNKIIYWNKLNSYFILLLHITALSWAIGFSLPSYRLQSPLSLHSSDDHFKCLTRNSSYMLLGHQIPMGFLNTIMNFSPTSVCSLKQMQLWEKIAAAALQADFSEKKKKKENTKKTDIAQFNHYHIKFNQSKYHVAHTQFLLWKRDKLWWLFWQTEVFWLLENLVGTALILPTKC